MDTDLLIDSNCVALPPSPGRQGEAGVAPAQLLEYARGRFAALPPHAAIELLDRPTTVDVPGAAYACDRLLHWRSQWLPLLDLGVLLAAHRSDHAMPSRYALVVAWQPAPRAALAYGALGLPLLPRVVQASDAAQCALPTDSDLWPLVALSCFMHEARPVPILDAAALFQAFLG